MALDPKTLPATIRITRLGVNESEFDEGGNLAPRSYLCEVCSSTRRLERYADDDYAPVDDDELQIFVDRHRDCTERDIYAEYYDI